MTHARRPSDTCATKHGVSALPLFLHRLSLLLRGVPLTVSAKQRKYATSTLQPLQQRQDRRGKTTRRAWQVMLPTARVQEYTDFIAADAHRHLHGAPRCRVPSTLTPTRSPSRHDVVYTDAYRSPLEAGSRLHRHLQGLPGKAGWHSSSGLLQRPQRH
jgi:hypothetical protein